MIPIDIADMSVLLDARIVWGPERSGPSAVSAIMTDSRVAAAAPALFFALRTERADGHDHIAAASLAGAVAAVVEREVVGAGLTQIVVDDVWVALGRLGRTVIDRVGCRVVAITGSYGKTTVKDLCAAALSAGRRVTASHASFNNELGVPLTMLSVDEATEVLVAEAGARNDGDLAVLGGLLLPDVSVITAVGPVHLETFGDEAGVAREKSRLVAALRPSGTAVLNADDDRVLAMAPLAPSAVTVSARGGAADVRAEDVQLDEEGRVRATVHTPWGSTDVALPMPGAHHLTNALLALAVAGVEGVDPVVAAEAIANATTSPSRSALHRAGGVTVLDDTYNASPPTMLGALRTLASLPCTGRRWAVLGVMAELGADTHAQHLTVGRACIGAVDELVVVGPAAAGIADGASERAGGPTVHRVVDHEEAGRLLADVVSVGDVVLLKASRVATLDRAAAHLVARLEEVDVA